MTKSMKGQSNHNLDAKGRLIVPARLRESLGVSFVLCQGMDHNIYAYPEEEWDKFSEKLNSLPISDVNARKFKTFFQGSANECEVDGQFRIVIPQTLRKWAGIDKEVVMVGNGSIAEIWDKSAWDKYNSVEEMDINEISMDMSVKYGI
ncbi:MAG: division/cell wall cluster transcriptional repressor MraZ [Wujia sp.]